jgi:hypothetical protein
VRRVRETVTLDDVPVRRVCKEIVMGSSSVPLPNPEGMTNKPAGGVHSGTQVDELVELRDALGTLHGCDGQTKWSGSEPAMNETGEVVCK